jgi:hypothetical protein
MILKFHEEVLKLFPPDFFDKMKNLVYVTQELFMKGVHYPDVPCAELANTNEGIKFLNYDPCKIPGNLAYLFFEDDMGLTETVQSHRGRQAIGHSMTYDPSVTMIELRQKILRRLEILYMLSLYDVSIIEKCDNDKCKSCYEKKNILKKSYYECPKKQPNIFWFGQIIHCIYDSYSRVHTLRKMPNKSIIKKSDYTKNDKYEYEINDDHLYKNNNNSKENKGENKNFSSRELENDNFILIRLIGNMIDSTQIELKEDTDDFFKNYIKDKIKNFDQFKNLNESNKNNIIKIIDDNPKRLAHIFKLILFFKQQKKNFGDLFENKKDYPSHKNINNHSSDYKDYPYIISFRYIGHQKNCDKTFHYNYDQYEKTNEVGFIEYIEENTKVIIDMYSKHLLDEKKSIKEKIMEFINYIAKNVFPIPEKYHNNPSAYLCSHKDKCQCELEKNKVYNLFFEHYKNAKEKKNAKDDFDYIDDENEEKPKETTKEKPKEDKLKGGYYNKYIKYCNKNKK